MQAVTDASFKTDVLEAGLPVLVDFWAPWCGPCKTLGPILESVVQKAAGKVRLVKINIDENQELAAQLRIQSVPTVYAFAGGRPVDAFVGAQPESKIRAFVEHLTKGAVSPIDDALEMAQEAMTRGDGGEAADLFAHVLKQEPSHPKALAGLIRARLLAGDLKGAKSAVKSLPADIAAEADVAAAVAAVQLHEESRAGTTDINSLKKKLQANPEDHAIRFDLASALFAKGLAEQAMDELLTIVKADRSWNDEAARKQLVRIFDALGGTHPATVAARKRLSSILFS